MRQKQSIFSLFLLSPSSRRAWIEISKLLSWNTVEGVDRNAISLRTPPQLVSRPPRGGRG